ncbi:MAG: N2,N2-dimethylguanosine tRNA methyltransferase [Synechococcaceae cyanobacterium]|nr:N2,N2-dimethylguanosine tRNA methyltransferase [Synechococcaceae cyanobacterium]
MLLARVPAGGEAPRVLDALAGCGIRSLRYALEGGAAAIWANDADAARRPLLTTNLERVGAPQDVRITSLDARRLLAEALVKGERFDLVDLDAFGCPSALIAPALEVLAHRGVLYLTGSDGRSPTGHDRPAAVRRLGAAARVHPASWEIALRLQLGVVARCAWMQGHGLEPLLSFSEGRTFRTAVRLRRRPAAGEERELGLVAHCHRCGDQQVQSLLRLGRWRGCGCGGSLAVSGPLWIGALQDPPTLAAMAAQASGTAARIAPASLRLLERLGADPGTPPRCWPTAEIGRRLGTGPPPLAALVAALQAAGHPSRASGIMAGQLRSAAPWPRILATARGLALPTAAR